MVRIFGLPPNQMIKSRAFNSSRIKVVFRQECTHLGVFGCLVQTCVFTLDIKKHYSNPCLLGLSNETRDRRRLAASGCTKNASVPRQDSLVFGWNSDLYVFVTDRPADSYITIGVEHRFGRVIGQNEYRAVGQWPKARRFQYSIQPFPEQFDLDSPVVLRHEDAASNGSRDYQR